MYSENDPVQPPKENIKSNVRKNQNGEAYLSSSSSHRYVSSCYKDAPQSKKTRKTSD